MPTIKQKKAFEAVVENGGNLTKAMETAGYAPSIVGNTEKLVDSDGWRELMATYLPDERLAQRHRELLESAKGETATKALDLAYKLKGSYAPEKSIAVNVELKKTLTPEQIEQINKVALDDA